MRRAALVAFGLSGLLLLVSPEASLQQTTLALSAPLSPDPRSISVLSGGRVAIEDELDSDTCDYGFVTAGEAIELEYKMDDELRDLYIYAEADRDIMLILDEPLGEIMCDDDSHSDLNPLIHIPVALSGTYTIFVGTYSSTSPEPATLFLSHTDPRGSSGGAPELALEPTYGRVTLAQDFVPDPHTVSVTAGGTVDVEVSGCSYGYVASAPDFNLSLTTSGGTDLYFYVRSDEDTTLLINRPDASWICDDDSLGDSNPVVTIPNAAGGLYNIWVGTYSDTNTPATLYISKKQPK